MTIKVRSYSKSDFKLVSDFLVETYQPGGKYLNWLQPRWEYMNYHPILDEENLNKIGIWEDDGKIVGIVNYEHYLGNTYYSINPQYSHLKREMIAYGEKHLLGDSLNPDKKYIALYIKDFDHEMEEIAKEKGYEKNDGDLEYCTITQLIIPKPFPEIKLPEGFKLKSLAEDNNLDKISRVLWRGFEHEGEPPEEEIEGIKLMQSAPNFRKDITIVVEAPDGNFAAFCGMWYDATNKIAFVEPVATDPDYRRMGLGKAAVMEGIRRCGELGATVAYVESALPIYLSIGFKKACGYYPWVKHFDK